MKEGDTFIPAKFDRHLWIVLSDPSIDAEQIVIVNFTTHTIDEESHCILQKGDHPFVKHKTAVRFRDAKVVSEAQLEKLIALGQLKPNRPLAAAILRKVRDGAANSEYLPEGCRQILNDQDLI